MNMIINKDLVKQLRKEKAWTQEELAILCDVNLRSGIDTALPKQSCRF